MVEDKYSHWLITQIELPRTVASRLYNDGLKTVGEVIAKSEAEVLRIPCFGHKSVKILKSTLGNMGLGLRDAAPLTPTHSGMPKPIIEPTETLRDRFAMAALGSVFRHTTAQEWSEAFDQGNFIAEATATYAIADAMMKARTS